MSQGMRQLIRGLRVIGSQATADLLQPLRSKLLVQRSLHVSCNLNKVIHVGQEKIAVGKDRQKLEVIHLAGESVIAKNDHFPDEKTPHLLFNGIPYAELPIVNVKATKNNTIFSLTDASGKVVQLHSAGVEGFKTCKKGTGAAAQQAAITLATRARRLGMGVARVRIQGFGLGRMNSIQGLTMGGIKIVSITDTTRVSPNPPRPPGARKL